MKQQATTQQLVQLGILIAALGGVLSLIGLFPSVTGVEPQSGIGVLQILILLAGMTLLILGIFLFVKISIYNDVDSTLSQRIAMRLSFTGLLFTAAISLSDVLGYGSNPPDGVESFPILGIYQTYGMVFGIGVALFGAVIFWQRGQKLDSLEDANPITNTKRTSEVDGIAIPDNIEIRKAQLSDANTLLTLQRKLDDESPFMLLEPYERQTTLEEQREIIHEHIMIDSNRIIFVADAGYRLVGYLIAAGGQYNRTQHTVHIRFGVLDDFSGIGIATELFKTLEQWAKEKDIKRLEFSVMATNERAIGLCSKMGFTQEGIKHQSLYVDDVYVDELYMAKLLG